MHSRPYAKQQCDDTCAQDIIRTTLPARRLPMDDVGIVAEKGRTHVKV